MNALIGFCILAFGIALGALAVFLVQHHRNKSQETRIIELIDYLEAASVGQAKVVTNTGEDELSKLQDEIGKTISSLHRLQAQALEEKESYAQNLANIAHQIKTPLTSLYIVLSQFPNASNAPEKDLRQIKNSIEAQLDRISALQENLLLMAKLDSGTLRNQRAPQDIFSLLNIVVDCLEDISKKTSVKINILDDDPIEIVVDEHWTSEALSNIVKNCIEHSPMGSAVNITYEENPLYVEVTIDDNGNGFDEDELTHLFERFYVGSTHTSESTGIGLSFARELLELQNATIQVSNKAEGGALFSIRFYRH